MVPQPRIVDKNWHERKVPAIPRNGEISDEKAELQKALSDMTLHQNATSSPSIFLKVEQHYEYIDLTC